MEKIESLINQVKVINDKYETLSKLNGEDFNIFSILKLETNEVKTHSNFIYELLNEKGSHNQGDVFLKLFLKQILEKEEYEELDSDIRVKQEEVIINRKRIDFTIKSSNIYIAIEMKINARDQESQLSDYYNYIKSKSENSKLYYLTLNGKEASAESSNGLVVDKNYFRISFYNDIYSWIEACIEKVATIPTIREGLVHYLNLIKKLTGKIGKNMGNDVVELIKTPKDMKAMYTLYAEYSNILAKKESEFWFELYEKIEADAREFKVLYEVDGNVINNKIDYKFIEVNRKIKSASWGLSFTYEIKKNYEIECNIYKQTSDSNPYMNISFLRNDNYLKFTESQSKILEKIGFSRKSDKDVKWFFLKKEIKFYGNGEPTFELFSKKGFEELVNETANECISVLEKIIENKDELLKEMQ